MYHIPLILCREAANKWYSTNMSPYHLGYKKKQPCFKVSDEEFLGQSNGFLKRLSVKEEKYLLQEKNHVVQNS